MFPQLLGPQNVMATIRLASGSIAMSGSGTSEYFGAVEGIAAKDLDKGIYKSEAKRS